MNEKTVVEMQWTESKVNAIYDSASLCIVGGTSVCYFVPYGVHIHANNPIYDQIFNMLLIVINGPQNPQKTYSKSFCPTLFIRD